MGVLADIFSASDAVKRRMKNLRQDPIGYLDLVTRRMKDKLTTPEGAQEVVLDNLGGPGVGGALGVIKNRGGNWLKGSVESALKGLKRDVEGVTNITPEMIKDHWDIASVDLRPKAAINNWIEGPLTRYVKRDMATPEDPIRALAEQGISHLQDTGLEYIPSANARYLRGAYYGLNTPPDIPTKDWNVGVAKAYEGQGKSDLAKRWESHSDSALDAESVERYLNPDSYMNDFKEPYMEKLNPDRDQIFRVSGPAFALDEPNLPRQLGFDHLIDELNNALDTNSGLPRNLLITPEQVQQMGIEKAVRHVDAINKWRAEQQIIANRERANNPLAVAPFKEYAENNPKGLKWVELKNNVQVAEKDGQWYPVNPDGSMMFPGGEGFPTKKEALETGRDLLEDALRYEGDTMQHCVGRYCNDVMEGRSRIYSLRDAAGEPHVTIEEYPNLIDMNEFSGGWIKGKMNQEDAIKAIRELEQNPKWQEEVGSRVTGGNLDNWVQHLIDYGDGLPRIAQVKGKANSAPKADYLPYVQDFVKSGKWGDVGDIQNTGLYRRSALTPEEQALVQGDYLTLDEIKALREGKDWKPLDNDPDW